VLADRLVPEAADAYGQAVAAAEAAGWGEGAVDDLVLLQHLLDTADDDLLKILGAHLKRLLTELAAEQRSWADGGTAADGWDGRRVPFGDHLLEAALNEAIDLNGSSDEIGGVHLVLALFFFPGCAAAKVLQRCGIDWRPLRSLARRLTGRSWFDW
jgi:hypothetical protein